MEQPTVCNINLLIEGLQRFGEAMHLASEEFSKFGITLRILDAKMRYMKWRLAFEGCEW